MGFATKSQIANATCRKLKLERINSIDDANKRARVLKDLYDIVRREMIEEHPWNFATKRQELVLSATKPPFEYENQFDLPADFIYALRDMNEGGGNHNHGHFPNHEHGTDGFEIEGRSLLTDATEIKLLYLADIEDTSLFPPAFVKALYLELAVQACMSLTQDKGLYDRLAAEAERALSKARTFGSQQDDSDTDTDPNFLTDVRLT